MLYLKKIEMKIIYILAAFITVDKVLITYAPSLRIPILAVAFLSLLILRLYVNRLLIGKHQIFMLVIGFLGVLGLSWSVMLHFDSVGLLLILIGISVIISTSNIEKEDIKKIEYVILVSGIVAAGALLLNGDNYYGTLLESRMSIDENNDPNFYAMYLLYPFFISYRFVDSKNRLIVLIGLSLMAYFMYAVFITGSRGALFALLVTLCYALSVKKRYSLLAMFVVMLFLIMSFVADYFSRFSLEVIIEHGGAGRLDIWLVGWEMFKDNCIFGVGLGNFENSFNEYATMTPNGLLHGLSRAPHNCILEIACELGMVGLCVYILLLKGIVFGKNKYIIRDDCSILFGLIAVLISTFFLSAITNKLVWFMLAIMESYKKTMLNKVVFDEGEE